MKSFVLAVALACVALGPAAAQTPPDTTTPLVKSYLEIQHALAADRFADVKAPAKTLASQASALGADGAAIAKAASAVESAADIGAARQAFGPLSDALIARVQAAGSRGDGELKLAFCPMIRRSWLQRDAQIRNPYFGASMSTCGEFKPLAK